MQAEPDTKSHLDNKGDVDGINFRPSSNFKHMKKYRKGAAAQGGEGSTGGRSEEEGGPSEWTGDKTAERANNRAGERASERAGGTQPPLPLEPPPPDSPPLTLKTEVEDEEYGAAAGAGSPPADSDGKTERRNMCRKWARGACPHGDACIFAHEIIISQLPGIFTFCNDFQNTTCSRPHCKFVHATVFEKEYFYRTGFLPPHATAHLKPPVVPTTSAGPTEGGAPEPTAVFPNPMPSGGPVVHPGVVGGGAECVPVGEPLVAAALIPPMKRELREADDLGAAAAPGSARPPDVPCAPKCNNCAINAYRLQCSKTRLEKVMRSTQELQRKRAVLEEKIAKQKRVLSQLARVSKSTTKPSSTKPGASLFSNGGFRSDVEKLSSTKRAPFQSVVEKIGLLLGHNGHAPASDGPNKELMTIMMHALMQAAEAAPAAGAPPSPEPGAPPSR